MYTGTEITASQIFINFFVRFEFSGILRIKLSLHTVTEDIIFLTDSSRGYEASLIIRNYKNDCF